VARPLRIEYGGALYHTTSRGNARQDIFLNDEDRHNFLEVLEDVVAQFNWVCHAYCLMSNHYHLLVETPDANFSRGMRQLNGVYTQAFNRRHKRVGHLLQGRYKAILVEKDSHLLELARYIVLNPVRVQLVRHPRDWRWSSYGATAGEEEPLNLLTTDWILSQFHGYREQAMKEYRRLVEQGYGADPWVELRGGVVLGTERFAEELKPLLEEQAHTVEIPRRERLVTRPKLEELMLGIEDKTERNERVYRAVRVYGYTLKDVADASGLHYSTVSVIVKRVAEASKHQK
jgi:putative transposase